MEHEPSPLSNTKLLEAKPIAKLMDTYLRINPIQNHRQQIKAYRLLASPMDFAPLY
jgi:hypothetical protein